MKKTRGKIIFIISIIFIVYVFVRSIIEVQLLKHYGVCKKGIITDVRLTSPHSKPDFMYKFEYKGEVYKGHSSTDDESQKWDSICIVFLESYPSIQRPITFFSYGETKCNCK
jgi:hypothetical protein